MFKYLAVAIVLALPTLGNAQRFGLAFLERYTIPVNPIDRASFETVEANGAGGTQLWCAAAIYTVRVLGVDKGELYVKEARGPSRTMQGRKGVVFTIEPVPGASKSYSEGVRQAGKSFSIGHADALCRSGNVGDVAIRLPNGRLLRRW